MRRFCKPISFQSTPSETWETLVVAWDCEMRIWLWGSDDPHPIAEECGDDTPGDKDIGTQGNSCLITLDNIGADTPGDTGV